MRAPLLIVIVAWLSCVPMAAAQPSRSMTVHLGSSDRFEVTATYRDPAEVDEKLGGTSVVPMWLSVKNVSSNRASLVYEEITLDLGGLAAPLPAVDPRAARDRLQSDGHFGWWQSLLLSQSDRMTRDPFSRSLRSGSLEPGQSRAGYVFFVRPNTTPTNGFMALGTKSGEARVLPTRAVEVMSPTARTMEWVSERWQRLLLGPPPFRKSYAVLMGVANYRYLKKLTLVKNDLEQLGQFLQGQGFEVIVIQDERLTVSVVKSLQSYLAGRNVTVTPEDRLLVFFAGHGIPRREGGQERGYLALADTRPDAVSATNAIAMDDFVAWTERVPAKHLLVLLESCFSGRAVPVPAGSSIDTMNADAMDSAARDTLYQLSRQPGRFLLMAGDADQEAPMADRWGGGLFAHAVMRGLEGRADVQGDGLVTARELFPWLQTYVASEAKGVGMVLTPLWKELRAINKGEFVFVATKNETRGRR